MWSSFWKLLMANDIQDFDADQIRHADVAYESRDLSHEAIFSFFLGLGIVIFVVLFVMWGVFKHLGSSEFVDHQSTNPIMTSSEQLKEIGGDPANSFPMPQLQPDPVADLNKFRIGEEQWMNTYGWVDQPHGRIHIPIETAIDMLAASWPQGQEQSPGGSQVPPGESAKSATAGKPNQAASTDDRGGNYGW